MSDYKFVMREEIENTVGISARSSRALAYRLIAERDAYREVARRFAGQFNPIGVVDANAARIVEGK